MPLRGLLALVALAFIVTALGAEPLHLLEGHGESWAPFGAWTEVVPPMGAATPGSRAGSTAPGDLPFLPDPHDCLSCLALSLTGAATGGVILQSPALRGSQLVPALGPAPRETRGPMDARPRAPPSA